MKDLLEMANSQTLELENDREEIRDRIEFADNEDFNSDTYDKILESINVLLDKKWPADFYLLFLRALVKFTLNGHKLSDEINTDINASLKSIDADFQMRELMNERDFRLFRSLSKITIPETIAAEAMR